MDLFNIHNFLISKIEKGEYYDSNSNHSENIKNIDKTNRSKAVKSLQWQKNVFTELNEIHSTLKGHEYINCDLRTFKKLFENREDFSPVEWNDTATSLIYFYGRLFECKKIKASAGKWKTLKSIFECENLNNAAQIYSSIKNSSKNLPEKSFFDSLIK